MLVCVSKRTQVYPLPMKYERAGMCNTQRNCGLIAERIVKAWRGVPCCWLWAILKKVGEIVERPKALGDIRGVTYIYGMFYRFGLINVPDEAKEKMKKAFGKSF